MKIRVRAARETIDRLSTGGLLLVSCLSSAATMASPDVTPQEERLFWKCNLAANQDRLTRASMRPCVLVYNKILKHRFDGDFLAYLRWRQANEPEQLKLLEAGGVQ